jgi:hypothetical protein
VLGGVGGGGGRGQQSSRGWSRTFHHRLQSTPDINLHGLPRGKLSCLRLRPHIGSVVPPVLPDAQTDVQVCTGGTHRCAGLYSRHTLRDNNAINKQHSLLIKRPGDKGAKCVLLHVNGWVTVVRK